MPSKHECPYSALQIYLRDRKRLYVFDLPEDSAQWDAVILQGLKTTDYGRCVYRMDNDQPDHLTVNILFRNGVTAAFSMEAFVSYEGRRTRIMGSLGDVTGDMESFTLTSFKTGKRRVWIHEDRRPRWRRPPHGARLGAGGRPAATRRCSVRRSRTRSRAT